MKIILIKFKKGVQMCGVVAVIGKQNASELVIEGLKKLEYKDMTPQALLQLLIRILILLNQKAN